jgi:hypothetical protein
MSEAGPRFVRLAETERRPIALVLGDRRIAAFEGDSC